MGPCKLYLLFVLLSTYVHFCHSLFMMVEFNTLLALLAIGSGALAHPAHHGTKDHLENDIVARAATTTTTKTATSAFVPTTVTGWNPPSSMVTALNQVDWHLSSPGRKRDADMIHTGLERDFGREPSGSR